MEQNFTIIKSSTIASAIYTVTISMTPTIMPTKHDEAQMVLLTKH
jgi:hypothetical protein